MVPVPDLAWLSVQGGDGLGWIGGVARTVWAWVLQREPPATQSFESPGDIGLEGQSATLLLAGGLVTLVLLLPLLLLGTSRMGPPVGQMPARPRRVDTNTTQRRNGAGTARASASTNRVGPGLEDGRRLGRELGRGAETLDDVLDQLVQRGLGEPRLTLNQRDLVVVSLYGCPTCEGREAANAPGSGGGPGCWYECGLLQGALEAALGREVVVREVDCRAQGRTTCDFEIWL